MNDIPLAPIPEKGAVPSERLKDAKSAREVFNTLREADKVSSQNRALVQGMFDGDAPYSSSELIRTGQSHRTNLNFGEAESQLEYAMSGYIDLTQSVENLITLRTTYGEVTQRKEWEGIIAEEITRTIRAWPQFHFNTLHLCHHFIGHGLGVGYWQDSVDWRFRAAGLGDFYFPRQTLASEDELEVGCASRAMPTWHLYRKIANPEIAKEMGWNVQAVRQALSKASTGNYDLNDWEKLEAEYKNNDLSYCAQQAEVKTIHLWVREYDNTITHCITTASDDCGNEFLYKKRNAFQSMQQAFVIFPFGLGTNALTHGIRGLGHKIFPMINVSNRLRSDSIDSARIASSVILQPMDEESLNDIGLTPFGGYTILNPNVKVETAAAPNLSYTLTPALQQMSDLLNQRVGSYSSQTVFNSGERKTRFEVAAQLEQASRLSNTSLELFYGPFQRVLREMTRRMSKRNYQSGEPGGREVADMRARILKRGVPLEAFYAIDIDSVHATRAIGAGSAAARTIALNTLADMAPGFDEEGQYNLRRDTTIALVGVSQADRYIPAKSGQRPPIDLKIAMLENDPLSKGEFIPVMPNEIHLSHLEAHVGRLGEYYEAVNSGSMELEVAAPEMMGIFNHASEHLALVGGDPVTVSKAAEYRQALQQIGEVVSNGMKAVESAQRKAAQEGQAAGAEQQGQSLEEIRKFEEHRANLVRKQEEHALKMDLMIQAAQNKRSIEDAREAKLLAKLLQ